jgi:type I restriction enzyme S subunit
MAWHSRTLGDLVSLQRGYDLPERRREDGPIPVYGSAGVNGYHSTARAEGPGVTIGRSGASFGVVHYSATDFWPHNTVLFVTDFHENDPRFVYYFLKNLNFDNFNSGSAQPSLNRNYLYSIPVRIPEPQVQAEIAAVLSAYDDLIENNTQRIAILEEMAQAIYREWFVNFRFPGHEQVEMVESELGPVPAGWARAPLKELCHLMMGQSPKSKYYNEDGVGLPFHQGVTDFGPRFPTNRVYCTVENRVAESGDVLFSVRAPVGRINIAPTKLVLGRGLGSIRSKADQQEFLFYQLKDRFREEDSMGGGTIFKSVTKADMLGIELLAPPPSVVEKFEHTVHPLSAQIDNLTRRNAVLRETRDLLLPRLTSGEIGVETLELGPQAIATHA